MGINDFKVAWCKFANKMNKYGVPIPMIRDPKTGLGSVSLTLLFISFNVVLIGLVGKWVEKLGGFDVGQALNLFYACAALYFGRNLGTKDGTKMDVPGTSPSNQSEAVSPVSQKSDDPDQPS